MSYYSDVYLKRLNRYGENPQERLDYGRELNFERFLKQSPHRVSFLLRAGTEEEKLIEGVLEPFNQNQTKTLMHLLCRVGETFTAGEIVEIKGYHYMFYYWDERQDSGYNRWCLMKLNKVVKWLNEDGSEHESEAYIYDQEDNMLKNELKSRSRSATLYLENLKLAFMLIPATPNLQYNSYLTLQEGGLKRSYRVTGFDFLSTPGVIYVSMDPTMERDLTPVRAKEEGDNKDDFFWLGIKGE